jgi:hypothetical protein
MSLPFKSARSIPLLFGLLTVVACGSFGKNDGSQSDGTAPLLVDGCKDHYSNNTWLDYNDHTYESSPKPAEIKALELEIVLQASSEPGKADFIALHQCPNHMENSGPQVGTLGVKNVLPGSFLSAGAAEKLILINEATCPHVMALDIGNRWAIQKADGTLSPVPEYKGAGSVVYNIGDLTGDGLDEVLGVIAGSRSYMTKSVEIHSLSPSPYRKQELYQAELMDQEWMFEKGKGSCLVIHQDSGTNAPLKIQTIKNGVAVETKIHEAVRGKAPAASSNNAKTAGQPEEEATVEINQDALDYEVRVKIGGIANPVPFETGKEEKPSLMFCYDSGGGPLAILIKGKAKDLTVRVTSNASGRRESVEKHGINVSSPVTLSGSDFTGISGANLMAGMTGFQIEILEKNEVTFQGQVRGEGCM